MYSQIPWELVADPLGTAEHTLGTTDAECMELCLQSLYLVLGSLHA